MKDLSKEEKLERQIRDMAEEYGDKKWMRVKRTFFATSAVIYFIVFVSGGMNCAQDYLRWILAAPISAGFVLFISYGVLFYMIHESMKEEKAIAKKIGELEAIKFSKYDKE
jgi:hypothetical protein